ncbi:MAG: tRNA (adenosine(37)-N6)-threonylcarbamoyltransferase complex dimerization subunit type 1 TsaB [Atribacterota bacterium]
MILAFDSSTPWLTVVVGNSQDIAFQFQCEARENHSRLLVDVLQQIGESRLIPSLTGVVVGLGPGSFTGVKIGNMFARGIAYCLELPLYGFSTLELMATVVSEEQVNADRYQVLVPVILHKQDEVFWTELSPDFRSHSPGDTPIGVGSPQEFLRQHRSEKCLVVTPWTELAGFFSSFGMRCYHPSRSVPHARGLIELFDLRCRWYTPDDIRKTISTRGPYYGSRIFET